jgi:hypothetical protein
MDIISLYHVDIIHGLTEAVWRYFAQVKITWNPGIELSWNLWHLERLNVDLALPSPVFVAGIG